MEEWYSLTRHRSVHDIGLDAMNTRDVIKTCLFAFPQIWASMFILVIAVLPSCSMSPTSQFVSGRSYSPYFSPADLTLLGLGHQEVSGYNPWPFKSTDHTHTRFCRK
jgi:hypothetical protein